MSTEELMNRILASLEFWGGSMEADAVASEVEENDGVPSPAYQTALNRLIAAGEVEEYIEPGERSGRSFTTAPDGSTVETTRRFYPALRLIGDAAGKAEGRNSFRNRFWIQDAIPVSYIIVDSDALQFAANSTVMTPPTSESGWWESQQWRIDEQIPLAEIVSGTWKGPIILPTRVVRYEETPEPEGVGRVGGIYSIPFDYAYTPHSDGTGGQLILVGQIPNDLVGPSPLDGVYVWQCIAVPDREDPYLDEIWQPVNTPTTEDTSAVGKEEFSPRYTTKGEPYVNIANSPTDTTGEDLICIALGRAGIPVAMFSHRGCTIDVPVSRKEEAIRILREDAERYGYPLRFNEPGAYKRQEALRNRFLTLRAFVTDRTQPTSDREEKLLALLGEMEELRTYMSSASFEQALYYDVGPTLVRWWRDRPGSTGKLDAYLASHRKIVR